MVTLLKGGLDIAGVLVQEGVTEAGVAQPTGEAVQFMIGIKAAHLPLGTAAGLLTTAHIPRVDEVVPP